LVLTSYQLSFLYIIPPNELTVEGGLNTSMGECSTGSSSVAISGNSPTRLCKIATWYGEGRCYTSYLKIRFI